MSLVRRGKYSSRCGYCFRGGKKEDRFEIHPTFPGAGCPGALVAASGDLRSAIDNSEESVSGLLV